MSQSNSEPTEAEIVAAFTEETPAEKPKKKLTKKAKIIIGLLSWLVLVGVAVALAFILKPAPEIEHLAPVIEEFKWVDDQSDKELDYVDIDYYGYYDANSIRLERIAADDDYSSPYYSIYYLRGLKNRTVEDKINSRIKETADQLIAKIDRQYSRVYFNTGASLNNVFSLYFTYYPAEDSSTARTRGLTFDLNTGNELSFDDIFIKNYDPTQYIHKAFYDGLSSNLQFRRKYLAQNISYAEYNLEHPEYYTGNRTADDDRNNIAKYRAEIAEIDAAFNDMESYSLEQAKKYLAGDKQFYLNAYGPAFIYDDGTSVIKSEAGDNAKYLAFYRDYKTNDSLFEDSSLGAKHIFYTYNDTALTSYYGDKRTIVESNNYLIETLTYSGDYPTKDAKYQEYIKNQLLALANQTGKFYNFAVYSSGAYRAGSSGYTYNYYILGSNITAEACSEDYYKSTYRKAIIDGKTQSAVFGVPIQPARTGRFNPAEIAKIDTDKIKGINALMDESGKIYTEAEEIFVEGSGWEGYLKQFFYDNDMRWENGRSYLNRYSDTEKAHHAFGYQLTGGGMVQVGLKDSSSTSGFSRSNTLPIYRIPNEYLKEPFRH